MSSNGSGPPLQIELRASPLLTVYLLLLLAMSLSAIALAEADMLFRLLLAVAVFAVVIRALCFQAWRVADDALVQLVWTADGQWTARTRHGDSENLQLAADSYWHARMLVLNFTAGGRRKSIVLLPDMLRPAVFRQLRVRLRLEGAGAVTPA